MVTVEISVNSLGPLSILDMVSTKLFLQYFLEAQGLTYRAFHRLLLSALYFCNNSNNLFLEGGRDFFNHWLENETGKGKSLAT